MKKILFLLSLPLFLLSFGEAPVLATEMGAAAGVKEAVDKDQLEGWIIGFDYRLNRFRLLDPRGFQRQVTTKPGTIGDYHLGDRVRVKIDPDYKRAHSIEKLY